MIYSTCGSIEQRLTFSWILGSRPTRIAHTTTLRAQVSTLWNGRWEHQVITVSSWAGKWQYNLLLAE